MGVPHTTRQLYQLADMTDEQRPSEAQLPAHLQRVADKVGGHHRRGGVDAHGVLDIVRAVVAGGKQYIIRAALPPLPQLYMDGVHQRLLTHRLYDPRGA